MNLFWSKIGGMHVIVFLSMKVFKSHQKVLVIVVGTFLEIGK